MKKNNMVETDERTRQQTGNAAVITLILIWLALIIIAVIKGIKYGYSSITEEVLLFLGSLLIFVLFNHRKGDVDLPRTIRGKSLPIDMTKEGKRARFKSYILDSLFDAAVIAGVNVGLSRLNMAYDFTTIKFSTTASTIVYNLIIDFVSAFVVFLCFNYFLGEHNVKKYNKMLEDE